MKLWLVLLMKEFKEHTRNFKLLWIPLMFLLLGISDPLTNYFMNDILSAVGNMPEGFQVFMPELTASDLILASTSQFQLIGLIVLVAVFASSISKERSDGTVMLIYIRPVRATSIFMSKWVAIVCVTMIAIFVGYAGSFYYINMLYESIPFSVMAKVVLTYIVWMLFVISFTLAMSALFKTSIALTLALLVIIGGQIVDSLIGAFWTVSPWKLANYGLAWSEQLIDNSNYWITVGITVALLLISIIVGIYGTERNRAQVKI